MKVLIAEDDPISRRLLETTLIKKGYEVVVACDGNEAWQVFRQKEDFRLAVLDWMMPEMDGVDVCRKIRAKKGGPYVYVILLTAKDRKEDIAEGLDAGADDYITKPFDVRELHARVQVGVRMLDLQNRLAEHVEKLEEALLRVKKLQGLLPICAYCKKIRNDDDYWQQVETYISEHSDVQFSHSICPDCYEKFVKHQLKKSTHRTKKVVQE